MVVILKNDGDVCKVKIEKASGKKTKTKYVV